MTDEELWKLFLLLRRPIRWDPPPPWVRMTEDQVRKFNEVQARFSAQIAQIEAEKALELGKIAGMK